MCGTVLAQSHWPEFDPNNNPYEMQGGLVAAIIINGEPITTEYEGWETLEIAAFVGDNIRANGIYLNDEFVLEFGDPYPVTWGDAVFYTNPGETLTFKMYDHSRGIEYSFVTALQYGEPLTLYTGEEHYEGWDNPDDVISLSFIPNGYTKHIQGYSADYDEVENPNDHYYLIASPLAENITPSTIAGMTEGTYDMYYFNQNGDDDQKEWINCKEVGGFAMENGVGYLYAHDSDIDLTFTGAANESDGTVELSYNGDANWPGWNLVGNPFAEPAYIERDYYTLQNGSDILPVRDGSAIDAMCGIFVLATGPDDNELTFSKNAPNSKRSSLSLNVSRANRMLDRTIVSFGGESVLPKFQLRANSTKVYIPMEGKDYAIVSAEGMGEMPVNFKAEKSGSYTISAKGEEVNFTYLHLIDNMTGADVDLLATPSYSFNASMTDYESRFRLLFATGSSEDGDNFGFVNGAGNLSIYGIEGEATLQVMDVNGRVLSTETFSGSYEKSLNVAAGIYMLRLTNGDNVRVQKMVIR